MAYVNVKVLPRRTAADKVLRYKAFNIDRKSKYHGYQHALTSVVIIFLIKRFQVVPLKVKLCRTNNWLKNYTNQLFENLKMNSTLIFYSQYLGC